MAIVPGTHNALNEKVGAPSFTHDATSQTVDANADFLVVRYSARRATSGSGVVTGVTIDPGGPDVASFTLHKADGSAGRPIAEIWFLKAIDIPASGAYTIRVTVDGGGTAGSGIQLSNFSSVSQTIPFRGTGETQHLGSVTAYTDSITTVSGDLVVEVNAFGLSDAAWTADAGQTVQADLASASRAISYGASTEPAVGVSVTVGWSGAASANEVDSTLGALIPAVSLAKATDLTVNASDTAAVCGWTDNESTETDYFAHIGPPSFTPSDATRTSIGLGQDVEEFIALVSAGDITPDTNYELVIEVADDVSKAYSDPFAFSTAPARPIEVLIILVGTDFVDVQLVIPGGSLDNEARILWRDLGGSGFPNLILLSPTENNQVQRIEGLAQTDIEVTGQCGDQAANLWSGLGPIVSTFVGPPPAAAVKTDTTIAYLDFEYGIDVVRGPVVTQPSVRGVVSLLGRNGTLVELTSAGPPMEFVSKMRFIPSGVFMLGGVISGNYVSAPDFALAGDPRFVMDLTPDDWTPASSMVLVAQWDGANQSIFFQLRTDGKLEINWVAANAISTVPVPFASGRGQVRGTLVLNNGSGNREIRFETRLDDEDPWILLGDVLTGSVASVSDVAANWELASRDAGTTARFSGTIHSVEIWDGTTLDASPDFEDVSAYDPVAGTVTDDQANVWTIQGDAGIKFVRGEALMLQSRQGLTLFPGGTNVETDSNDFSLGILSNVTVTPNTGLSARRLVEADKVEDDDAGADGDRARSYTVPDDSGTHHVVEHIEKDPAATVKQFLSIELTGGSTEIVETGIYFSVDDGSYMLPKGTLAGGVIDTGRRWRVWATIKNNSTGNVTLTTKLFPARGTVLGVTDNAAIGAVTASGHIVKAQHQLTPWVVAPGAISSHVGLGLPMTWTIAPAGMVGYLLLMPWQVAGHGQGNEMLFTIGGDAIANEAGLSIYLQSAVAGGIGATLSDGATNQGTSSTRRWMPGNFLEVFWTLSDAGVISLQHAVEFGDFTAPGVSTALTLPANWASQAAALGELVGVGAPRSCATWLRAKFEADPTLTAEQMRSKNIGPPEGI